MERIVVLGYPMEPHKIMISLGVYVCVCVCLCPCTSYKIRACSWCVLVCVTQPLSLSPPPSGAGSEELMFEYNPSTKALTIRRPGVNILEDFTITIYDG